MPYRAECAHSQRNCRLGGHRANLSHGADDGNRTRVASLEDWGSTIELHPRALTRRYSLADISETPARPTLHRTVVVEALPAAPPAPLQAPNKPRHVGAGDPVALRRDRQPGRPGLGPVDGLGPQLEQPRADLRARRTRRVVRHARPVAVRLVGSCRLREVHGA